MAKKNYDLLFKLLLIGDSGVGKVSETKELMQKKQQRIFL
jgi:GTPase SAR1 family protein